MQHRKSFFSAFLSIILIPVMVIIILIDKPDYDFFNFIHRTFIPTFEIIGQGITYPVRLIGNISANFRKNRINLKENEEIMNQLAGFQKMSAENEILRQEITLLHSKLRVAEDIKFETAAANIIHNNSFMEKQVFIISDPAPESKIGNIIISNNGYLLGIITEKTGRFATIQSVKDGDSNIPVRIAGTSIFGFLQGTGARDPELRFLSDGDFIPKEGMFLITSGVNGNIPDNIPVGRIKEVSNNEIRVGVGAELKEQESVIVLLFEGENYDLKKIDNPQPDAGDEE